MSLQTLGLGVRRRTEDSGLKSMPGGGEGILLLLKPRSCSSTALLACIPACCLLSRLLPTTSPNSTICHASTPCLLSDECLSPLHLLKMPFDVEAVRTMLVE